MLKNKIIYSVVICLLIGGVVMKKMEDKKMNGLIPKEELIFKTGNQYKDNFIGDAFVEMMVVNKEYDMSVYNVTFKPACRNSWHKHSVGQILLVTGGEGYYQEKGKPAQFLTKGDIVEIPANVVHWHGAAPDKEFIHVGITPQMSKNDVEWLEPVEDEEYLAATKK